MVNFGARLKHAWNAFANEDKNYRIQAYDYGAGYGVKPDRNRLYVSNERSIISSIYMRLSIDVSAAAMLHVRLDENKRFLEEIDSGLNNCLTVEANIDQAAKAFRQDIALSLFNEGVIAVVPVDTSFNPQTSGSYDIRTMRVGRVVQWYPKHVRVSLYNDTKGIREEVTLEKNVVAIIENPLYTVMNEPNSTLQRLIQKLNLLDTVDNAASSGKLDLIIQLPYVIKSEARKQQAEQRRKDIEFQLKSSTYGIAYTDGTEKITQLNRPAENTLLLQVKYLTELLYNQLGLTEAVMNGTADQQAMLNYSNRTIEPILDAITEAFRRTFLTKTARSQGQSIEYFRDPFKFIPINDIAEIADKFTRNEILTSNEFRQILGFKPSGDPKADELRNSNMPPPNEVVPEEGDDGEQGALEEIDVALDEIFNELGIDESEDESEEEVEE